MGYNVYITRAESWSDNRGSEIAEAEGTAVIEADPELAPLPELGPLAARWTGPSTREHPWLVLEDGNVHTKSPDPALIAKMVRIAERLGAIVQGDDGEPYPLASSEPEPTAAGSARRPAGQGLLERVVARLGSAKRATTPSGAVLRRGGRVREVFGDRHEGTIVAIDSRANLGLGEVVVRLDDGRTVKHSLAAPGIDPLD